MEDKSINKWVRDRMESGKDDMQRYDFVDWNPDCDPECMENEDEICNFNNSSYLD